MTNDTLLVISYGLLKEIYDICYDMISYNKRGENK